MSYLLTQGSRIHSPVTVMIAYSMANSKHKHVECRVRAQSRISILIQLIKTGRISFPFIPNLMMEIYPLSSCIHRQYSNSRYLM